MTTELDRVRPPAVAGTFYPADPEVLRATIGRCFLDAVVPPAEAPPPPAVIVPHAGYVYSGPIAASAYARLRAGRATIRRVVVLGPSHRVPVRGLATSTADAWATPLGLVRIDADAAAGLGQLTWVRPDDRAHAFEHSIEVQLPFLQTVLDDFTLVPLAVGDAGVDEVASVIDALWSPPTTIVVVSTDLSHYHHHADAARLDARTAAAIAALRPDDIGDLDACGARPLRGLLRAAEQRHLVVEPLDLRSSGDTAGDKERVVGYGAFAVV